MAKNKNKHLIPKSDGLFKSTMETEVAISEFLEMYLPNNLKNDLDIAKAQPEKESYVEEDLKRRMSDVVYSIPYKNKESKNGEKVYVYTLIEHQSSPDKWIALKLWKYIMLLCERHKEKNEKLPIVIPYVFYNGKVKYNAPKCLWGLFDNPTLAKDIMVSDYKLIDLQSMTDEEIQANNHFGMLQYFMKNIHEKDMIKLWETLFEQFRDLIYYDKEKGYLYIKKFIWYTDGKLGQENQENLRKVILNNLPKNEGEEIMSTIADNYIDQGRKEKEVEIAKIMLKNNISISDIKKYTSLSEKELKSLNTTSKNSKKL